MKFSLALPREALSIPVIRRILGNALGDLGVSEDCIADILVATCEACTNVVKHAQTSARYEVLVSVDDTMCVLKIVDRGATGWSGPAASEGAAAAAPSRSGSSDDDLEAESGRGIKIMRALVDDVSFDAAPERGMIVYLQKRLTWRHEALLRRLEYDLVHSAR
jgi:serine/threonine-protein kinase RsbW